MHLLISSPKGANAAPLISSERGFRLLRFLLLFLVLLLGSGSRPIAGCDRRAAQERKIYQVGGGRVDWPKPELHIQQND